MQRTRIAESSFTRRAGRERRRTHTRVFRPGAEVEIHRTPNTVHKEIEVVLLARRRAAKEIPARCRRRALIIFSGKRTRVLDHAIRSRPSLWSKLAFENTVVAFIDTGAKIGLTRQLKLDLRFVVKVLRTSLPVKIGVEVCVDAPGDQFRFRLWHGVVTNEPVWVVGVRTAIETDVGDVVTRAAYH